MNKKEKEEMSLYWFDTAHDFEIERDDLARRLTEAIALLEKHWTSSTIEKEETLNRLRAQDSAEPRETV